MIIISCLIKYQSSASHFSMLLVLLEKFTPIRSNFSLKVSLEGGNQQTFTKE